MTKTIAPKQIHLIAAERGYMIEPDGDIEYEHKIFGSYSDLGRWISDMGEDTWTLRVVYESENRIGALTVENSWQD